MKKNISARMFIPVSHFIHDLNNLRQCCKELLESVILLLTAEEAFIYVGKFQFSNTKQKVCQKNPLVSQLN